MDFFFKESFRCSTTNIRGKILIQKKNVIFKKKKKGKTPNKRKHLLGLVWGVRDLSLCLH